MDFYGKLDKTKQDNILHFKSMKNNFLRKTTNTFLFWS